MIVIFIDCCRNTLYAQEKHSCSNQRSNKKRRILWKIFNFFEKKKKRDFGAFVQAKQSLKYL